MTPTETVMLARYVKALCPQQAIDDYTPDAWHDVLRDYDLDECRAAVVAVASRQPFVAPSEIIGECDRERRAEQGRKRRAEIDAMNPEVPAISPAILAIERGDQQLKDPRPLKETIRDILRRHGRAELMPASATPPAPSREPLPRDEQLRQLEQLARQEMTS